MDNACHRIDNKRYERKTGAPRYAIVYFATAQWDFLHHRMHALPAALAARGHDVYVVNSIFSRRGYKTSFNHSRLSFTFSDETFQNAPAPGIHEIIIPRRLTFGKLKFNPPFIMSFASRWLAKLVDEIRRRSGLPVALIYSSPGFSSVAARAKGEFVAFDFVDDPQILLDKMKTKEYNRREREIIEAGDYVFVTAWSLAEYVQERYPGARIEYLPNGVDFDWFNRKAQESAVPEELQDVPRPIAGFAGMLFKWIDVPLLIRAAKARPDVSFVFVGYREKGGLYDELIGLPNVRYFKERPYEEMPAWIKSFDVCLIPFAPGTTAKYTNPKKLYEYLAPGKPAIVSSHIAGMAAICDIVYIYEGEDGFLTSLDIALKESNRDLATKRIAFARENSWNARAAKLETLIANRITGQRANNDK